MESLSKKPAGINDGKRPLETYSVLKDEDELLHHVLLNMSHLEYLDKFYNNQEGILVMRSNCREYIENIKGAKV